MDDRKKRIDNLIKNNQENRSSLETLLENFGEKLYIRTKDIKVDFEDIIEYNICLQDIAEANVSIGKIEEKNRRFRELEDNIEAKELEEKDRAKALSSLYRKLGKALLENNAYDDFTSLFSDQAAALKSRLESLEVRISELDNKEGGNVFSWIGKSAQGLVMRSFLSKAQENQEQLYHNVGEHYSNRDAISQDDDVAVIRSDIDMFKDISRKITDELSVLKDEKRIILAGFGIDGNPQKQIQSAHNHIAQIKAKLRSLYRNFGAQASGIMDDEIKPERKYFIDTIVTAEDGEIIGRVVRLNQAIAENEKAINKLRASLSIDEEKNKIEKYRRTIIDRKNRIVDLEREIIEFEDSVSDCEKYIQELEKQL